MSRISAEDWERWEAIFGRLLRGRYTHQPVFPFDAPPSGRTAASVASEDRTGAADRAD